jgi:PleD family two-component response regulator
MSFGDIAPGMEPVGFSAGIVETSGADFSPEELFTRVDNLLYEGKRAGRGRVHGGSLCPAGEEEEGR